jgi:hypothetical protein
MPSTSCVVSVTRSLYGCFDRRTDAIFDLTDAILTAGVVPSPVHLSLEGGASSRLGQPIRRADCGKVEEALGELVARHSLEEDRGAVYGVDLSVWPRSDAEASPQRGYYYLPSRLSAGQPIVACSGLTSGSHGLALSAMGRLLLWTSSVFIRARTLTRGGHLPLTISPVKPSGSDQPDS